MKKRIIFLGKYMFSLAMVLTIGLGCMAQPLPPGNMPQTPPPGLNPPPGPGPLTPPPPQTPPPVNPTPPPPPPPAGWGGPGFLAGQPENLMNQGTINVMATGYDTESVLVQIPLVVSYVNNGAYYDVTVINSWSPLTQTWNYNVDAPAYQTDYYFNGFTYNYYVNIPSGTFYFNL